MADRHKSWHKMPGEKQEHYDMLLVWLGLPYEDPPKERTVREVYRRKTGATGNPSSHYFRVRDDNRWGQRPPTTMLTARPRYRKQRTRLSPESQARSQRRKP